MLEFWGLTKFPTQAILWWLFWGKRLAPKERYNGYKSAHTKQQKYYQRDTNPDFEKPQLAIHHTFQYYPPKIQAQSKLTREHESSIIPSTCHSSNPMTPITPFIHYYSSFLSYYPVPMSGLSASWASIWCRSGFGSYCSAYNRMVAPAEPVPWKRRNEENVIIREEKRRRREEEKKRREDEKKTKE